jgi:hypothetical protein
MLPLLSLLFLSFPASSAVTLSPSGSVKNLQSFSRSRLNGRPIETNLTRARLSLNADVPLAKAPSQWEEPTRALSAHVDYDHELRFGSFLRSPDFRLLGFSEPEAHFNLTQNISSGTAAHYRHRLYRGWIELREGAWRLRFGRQRIAWGTGKIWNAVDFLNPYNITLVERSERRGVDATYLRRPLGALGQAEGVYTLADNWSQTDLLTRLRGQFLEADISVLGGKVAGSSGSFAVGGDFVRDLAGGSLRGEWLYADLKVRAPFGKMLVGYEYSWAKGAGVLSDVWATLEYFHNGAGARSRATYNTALLASGREVTLARDYLGAGFSKELHPLLKIESFMLWNLSDSSHYVGPQLDWNAVEALHLSLGWQAFGGRPRSEYGRQPNVFFFQGQYFF